MHFYNNYPGQINHVRKYIICVSSFPLDAQCPTGFEVFSCVHSNAVDYFFGNNPFFP